MTILLALIIGSTLKYLDLCVSEKYETQLEGLNPTKKEIESAIELQSKINKQKEIALFTIALSLFGIYFVSLKKK